MRPDRFVSENLLCYWERGSESMLCLAGEVGFPGVWNGDRVFCQGNEVSYFRHCKFENIYRDSKKKKLEKLHVLHFYRTIHVWGNHHFSLHECSSCAVELRNQVA